MGHGGHQSRLAREVWVQERQPHNFGRLPGSSVSCCPLLLLLLQVRVGPLRFSHLRCGMLPLQRSRVPLAGLGRGGRQGAPASATMVHLRLSQRCMQVNAIVPSFTWAMLD